MPSRLPFQAVGFFRFALLEPVSPTPTMLHETDSLAREPLPGTVVCRFHEQTNLVAFIRSTGFL
jgi:hypothetical protein